MGIQGEKKHGDPIFLYLIIAFFKCPVYEYQLPRYIRWEQISERLTSRVKIRCKRASNDFEFLSNGCSLNLETWSKKSKFIRVAIVGVWAWLMREKCDFTGEMWGKVEISCQPFLYLGTSDHPGIWEVA